MHLVLICIQEQEEVIINSEKLKSSRGDKHNDVDEDVIYNFISTLVVIMKTNRLTNCYF